MRQQGLLLSFALVPNSHASEHVHDVHTISRLCILQHVSGGRATSGGRNGSIQQYQQQQQHPGPVLASETSKAQMQQQALVASFQERAPGITAATHDVELPLPGGGTERLVAGWQVFKSCSRRLLTRRRECKKGPCICAADARRGAAASRRRDGTPGGRRAGGSWSLLSREHIKENISVDFLWQRDNALGKAAGCPVGGACWPLGRFAHRLLLHKGAFLVGASLEAGVNFGAVPAGP